MKKITLLLLLLVSQLQAQYWSVNTCSSNNSSIYYGPLYTTISNKAASRFGILYKASNLTALQNKQLNKIYFNRSTPTGQLGGTPNMKIYLKEVDVNELGTTAMDWSTETQTATLVYDANPTTIIGTTAGYKGFPLTNNFNYSTKSLLVLVEYSNQTQNSTKIEWLTESGTSCVGTTSINTKSTYSSTGTLNNTLGSTSTDRTYRRALIGFDYVENCTRPKDITTAPDFTTANIQWNAGATETQWEYAITSPSASVPTTGIPTNTNQILIDNLTEGSTYNFYVRANCNATDNSVWTGPFTFTTNCKTPATTPYTENFETNASNILPGCSKVINYGTGNSWDITTNPGAGFTSYTLRYIYNISAPANTWFFTKGIQLEQGKKYKITFDYGSSSSLSPEKLKVAIGSEQNNTSMSTILFDNNNIVTGTKTAGQAIFTPATSGVYYLGFQAYSDANKFRLYVDNINMTEEPSLNNDEFIVNKSIVSPNPFINVISIRNEIQIQSISIYNLLGTQIDQQSFNATDVEISTEKLNSGAYLLKVITEEGTQIFKMIKK